MTHAAKWASSACAEFLSEGLASQLRLVSVGGGENYNFSFVAPNVAAANASRDINAHPLLCSGQ